MRRTIVITTQTFPPTVGGMEFLMGGLAGALSESGEKVAVFADRKDDTAEQSFDTASSLTVRRFGGPRMLRRLRKARYIACASDDARVIIADSWKSLEWLNLARPLPMICLVHGSDMLSNSRRRTTRIRRALDKADYVVANSSYSADLACTYLAQPERVTVIPPGITLPDFPDLATDEYTAIIDEYHPVLVTIARLEPRKGIDVVIRALPELIQVYPNLLYLIIGEGEDKAHLQQLTATCGVAAHVRFVGRVLEPNKLELLRAADLFVMTSRQVGRSVEGFGIVYLEAAACGVPSLGAHSGGAAGAIVDGETGFLCDGENPQVVKQAIVDALADPDRLARMGSAAKNYVAQFSWDEISRCYLALIDSIVR